MHLTRYTDLSLRVLLYLAAHDERRVAIGEISHAYSVSRNHLVKVVQNLARLGWVRTIRGRRGGVVLDADPKSIRVGDVVRKTEPGFELAECLDTERVRCSISSACGLRGILGTALDRFLDELDRHTIDGLLATDDLRATLRGPRPLDAGSLPGLTRPRPA